MRVPCCHLLFVHTFNFDFDFFFFFVVAAGGGGGNLFYIYKEEEERKKERKKEQMKEKKKIMMMMIMVMMMMMMDFFYMNTCRVPHLEINPERFTVATIALFSASKQTQCALVVCDSE